MCFPVSMARKVSPLICLPQRQGRRLLCTSLVLQRFIQRHVFKGICPNCSHTSSFMTLKMRFGQSGSRPSSVLAQLIRLLLHSSLRIRIFAAPLFPTGGQMDVPETSAHRARRCERVKNYFIQHLPPSARRSGGSFQRVNAPVSSPLCGSQFDMYFQAAFQCTHTL